LEMVLHDDANTFAARLLGESHRCVAAPQELWTDMNMHIDNTVPVYAWKSLVIRHCFLDPIGNIR